MAQVLGLSRGEASELLQKGDVGFILRTKRPADFSQGVSQLKQLNRVHPAAPFYAGLLISETEQKAGSPEENKDTLSAGELEILLFCAALESPSPPARREAARKLIPLTLQSQGEEEARDILGFLDSMKTKGSAEPVLVTLRAACLFRLGRYDETVKLLQQPEEAWDRALALFAAWKAPLGESAASSPELFRPERFRQEIPAFLFETLPADIRRWAFRETLSQDVIPSNEEPPRGLLSAEETAALSNKLSPAPYQTFLNNMRPALLDGGIIFFRYPDLIADLGRAYQYTPARREEGAKLFRAWETLLEAPGSSFTPPPSLSDENEAGDYRELEAFVKTLDREAVKARSFLLFYYSGRIERAREEYAASSESFNRALEFAPDVLQSDACIWYTLMNALNRDPSGAVALTLSTMPLWNDGSYFADILDRLSAYLVSKRQWTGMAELFAGLEKRKAGGASLSEASLAQYAWILGRAVQEGYLKADRDAESFFRFAFEEGKGSFYYRAMAASKLNLTFAPEGDSPERKTPNDKEREDETEFILGFFKCGASSLALPYLREREGDLGIPELRSIAEAFSSSGRWKEALDLISRYTGREDYEISRRDLLLFYPRPFQELIEKNAGETELGAEILYGLIRTESYFMPEVVSRSGAVGLAQLMAPTAEEMAGRIARQGGPDYRGGGGINLKDPEVNIHIGSYYLRYLTERMGSPMLALLAYNGGMGRVRRWLTADKQQKDSGLPQDLFLETIEFTETREYGRRVLAAAAVYGYLYYGMNMESVAADIYRTD